MFKPKQIQKQERIEMDKKQKAKEGQIVEKSEQAVGLTREIIEEEKAYRRGILSIRDLIAPASMQIFSDHLKLGNKFVRTIFVIGYPRYISVGWFSPIINLSSTFDISMFFYPVKSAIILKQLKKKVGALEAQIISDTEKGAARDPIRETALRDIEALRDALTQGIEKFFQFALYITLHANSKEDLDRLSDEVENVLGSRLVYSKRVFYQAEHNPASRLDI